MEQRLDGRIEKRLASFEDRLFSQLRQWMGVALRRGTFELGAFWEVRGRGAWGRPVRWFAPNAGGRHLRLEDQGSRPHARTDLSGLSVGESIGKY